MERLDKFLCDSGAGTRSQVKLILRAGRVQVDGAPEKDGGRKIDPAKNEITLDGVRLAGKDRAVFMMNKPEGYVTATGDAREKTVMELLPAQLRHLELKPVGRLDKATEGLLLFTNDGELLHRLISPKKEVPKVYYARHEGTASRQDADAFAAGLTLADGTSLSVWQASFDREYCAPDGTVLPCQSWLEGPGLGNLCADDWAAIWDGPQCRRIRSESAKMEHICQLQQEGGC